MNAPIPPSIQRQLGAMTQPEAVEALDRLETEFDAAVTDRADLIERAALPEDVTEVLGALALPEEVTVICAAFRSGCPDVLGPLLIQMLRREWRETAEIECLRLAEAAVSVGFSVADITQADMKRAAVLRDMGVKHG